MKPTITISLKTATWLWHFFFENYIKILPAAARFARKKESKHLRPLVPSLVSKLVPERSRPLEQQLPQ